VQLRSVWPAEQLVVYREQHCTNDRQQALPIRYISILVECGHGSDSPAPNIYVKFYSFSDLKSVMTSRVCCVRMFVSHLSAALHVDAAFMRGTNPPEESDAAWLLVGALQGGVQYSNVVAAF
jgi:hypothetical protein